MDLILLRRSITIAVIWVVPTFGIPARASENHYLVFQEAVRTALQDNADLSTLRYQETALKYRASLALAPNEPVLSYAKTDLPGLYPGLRAAENTYGLSMLFGFPGKAVANSASYGFQADGLKEQAYSKEIELVTAIADLYVSLARNAAYHRTLIDQRKKDESLLKILERKFGASQASKVDLLGQRVALARDDQSILTNENEYRSGVQSFRVLIRKPLAEDLFPKLPERIEIPVVNRTVEDLSRLMHENRQSLRAARAQVGSSKSLATVALLSPLPDFQISAAINTWNVPSAAPNPGVTRDYTLGVSVSIPLFFPFNELTAIRAASADLQASQSQLDAQEISALAGIRKTYDDFSASRLEAEHLEKIVLPAARASYDLTLLTFSMGRADYFRLSESRRSWMEAQSEFFQKQELAFQFYHQLVIQVGCDFGKSEGPHACE
ncbi:MAG: TolC family protein [Cryobacterium sp.]|nr:TolC family protein [Oligoflexia bacterium]